MNTVITFATKEYYGNARLLKSSLNNVNFITYNEHDIIDFKKENPKIFKEKRGYGVWSWKPYIILKTLEKMNENEIVFYVDSGLLVVSNMFPLFDIANKENYLLFCTGGKHLNKKYTTKKCFELMECDEEKYHNCFQAAGGYQAYKKTPENVS